MSDRNRIAGSNRVSTFSCFSSGELEKEMNEWLREAKNIEVYEIVIHQPFYVEKYDSIIYSAAVTYMKL